MIFLLLIFFLLTSTFSDQPGLKIQLPRAFSSQPREAEDLVISITREGRVYVNQKPIERSRLGAELEKLADTLDRPSVILKADREVSYGLVVELIDLSRRAGLEKIVALTASGKEFPDRIGLEDLLKERPVNESAPETAEDGEKDKK